MPNRQYLQHGSRHLPTGSDPIPTLDVTVPTAIYVGDVSGGSPISIGTGVNALFVKFAGCTTTNTDIFELKGGGSPYFAKIPAGAYYWLLELDFGDAPPLQMEPIGGNASLLSNYGQFFGCPIWNSNTTYGHTDQRFITPGTDDILSTIQSVFDGVIDTDVGIADLNVTVLMESVVAAAELQGVILSIFKMNEHPVSSAIIVP